jgi:hypothetical protein
MSTTTPSMSYLGNRVGQLAEQAGSYLRNTVDQIRTTAQAASTGLRQEVPFERWFFNHGFEKPLKSVSDSIKARVWALAAACESGLRASVETVAYVFSLVFARKESHRHLDVLKAQGQSLALSLLAIVSPNAAKQHAHNPGGKSRIGCSLFHWKWGTLYTGKFDAPFWHLECRQYPWTNRS